MKGIILAGGTGSRLHPLTKVTNKHLLPMGNHPMIVHNIKKLVNAKITDIMIITGTEHMGDMISLLGSGAEYGCSFTFRVQNNRSCQLLLKEVPDPERYGVAAFQGNRVTKIEEKPKHPKSNHAITGIYMYDNKVFGIIDTLTPSARGEYEITDINNAYIHAGEMFYKVMKGWWTDAGTLTSYQKANQLVTSHTPGREG